MAIQITCLLISTILYCYAPSILNTGYMSICVLLAIISIMGYSYHERKRRLNNLSKIHFRHVVFFIFCYIIVFYQADVDLLFGFEDESNSYLWVDTRIVCRSLALSNLGLHSLLIGSMFYKESIKNVRPQKIRLVYFQRKTDLCYIGFFLLFLYLILVDKQYLFGGYSASSVDAYGGILVIMQALFIAILTMYSFNYRQYARKESFAKYFTMPIALMFTYVIIVFMSGRRTEGVRVLSLLLICYIYAKRGVVNYKRFLLLGVILAVVVSLIGILRNGHSANNLKEGVEVLRDKASIMPVTKELSVSVSTLHIAMASVPDEVGYNYGLTFFPGFAILVPGLDRLISDVIGIERASLKSDMILSVLMLGDAPSYGVGSSVVADTYISFGPIGVIVVFLLLGVFFRKLEVGTFSNDASPYFIAMSFCCYSQFMYCCRGSVSILFLSLTYSLIILLFFTQYSKKLYNKTKTTENNEDIIPYRKLLS